MNQKSSPTVSSHLYQLFVYCKLFSIACVVISSFSYAISATFSILGLPLSYCNILCVLPFNILFLNWGQDIFYFGILSNPLSSLPIPPFLLLNGMSLKSFRFKTSVTLFTYHVRNSKMHLLFNFLFSESVISLFVTVLCLPKTFHPCPYYSTDSFFLISNFTNVLC